MLFRSRLLSTNELREGDFGEWFQYFWGGIRLGLDCIFAIWRYDSKMFQATDVVDVEVELEHGGVEK